MNLSNYKFHPVKITGFLFLALCMFSFSGCFSESEITETEVLDVIDKMDVAAKNKDSDGIVANISEKVQIKATAVTLDGKTQTDAYTRDQYRNLVKRVFDAATNYQHNRRNTKVKISPDGTSAIVTSELSESVTINGQIISSVETSVSTFVKENGKLVIRYIDITGKQV